MLLVVGFAAGIVGCAEKEQTAPERGSAMEPAAGAVTEAPEVEPEAAPAQIEDWRNLAFLDHMHVHAEQLDDLNFALADDDLERAMGPAYWLSRHKTVSGVPSELQPFVDGMREAASAVEEADDLVAARAAAQRIGVQCQGCHAAMGVAAE
jgi:cytochrome c556